MNQMFSLVQTFNSHFETSYKRAIGLICHVQIYLKNYFSSVVKRVSSRFPNRSDTNKSGINTGDDERLEI